MNHERWRDKNCREQFPRSGHQPNPPQQYKFKYIKRTDNAIVLLFDDSN